MWSLCHSLDLINNLRNSTAIQGWESPSLLPTKTTEREESEEELELGETFTTEAQTEEITGL